MEDGGRTVVVKCIFCGNEPNIFDGKYECPECHIQNQDAYAPEDYLLRMVKIGSLDLVKVEVMSMEVSQLATELLDHYSVSDIEMSTLKRNIEILSKILESTSGGLTFHFG